MKNSSIMVLVMLFGWTIAIGLPLAEAQADRPSNAADVGSPVRSMLELGSVFPSIYDITVTVLETVRGGKVAALLQEANASVLPPTDGFEYLLARVKFEMRGRSVRDRLTFDLGDSSLQWVAFSSDITEYEGIAVDAPDPKLKGTVRPGQSLEGWVAFAVETKEKRPIMVFDPDSGGANGRGKPLFFNLY